MSNPKEILSDLDNELIGDIRNTYQPPTNVYNLMMGIMTLCDLPQNWE